MRHFYRLAEDIVTLPIMNSIMRNGDLWNIDKMRTTFNGTPHAQVSDIILRFGDIDGIDLETSDRDAMKTIVGAKQMALSIMQLTGGSRLGRVIVSKLEPGKKILPHKDVVGDYSKYYTRYALVLQGLPGSIFCIEDEAVNMVTGELWWTDVHSMHEIINNSKDDRVHMLVDVRIDP